MHDTQGCALTPEQKTETALNPIAYAPREENREAVEDKNNARGRKVLCKFTSAVAMAEARIVTAGSIRNCF